MILLYIWFCNRISVLFNSTSPCFQKHLIPSRKTTSPDICIKHWLAVRYLYIPFWLVCSVNWERDTISSYFDAHFFSLLLSVVHFQKSKELLIRNWFKFPQNHNSHLFALYRCHSHCNVLLQVMTLRVCHCQILDFQFEFNSLKRSRFKGALHYFYLLLQYLIEACTYTVDATSQKCFQLTPPL